MYEPSCDFCDTPLNEQAYDRDGYILCHFCKVGYDIHLEEESSNPISDILVIEFYPGYFTTISLN